MSELKARHIVDVYDDYAINPFGECSQVYLKSEADKVIALLTDKSNYNEYAYKRKSEELADSCRFYEDELRRQKYKRCMDKAKLCESEEKRLEAISPIFDTDKECWEYNSDYWYKWRKLWMELTEKFKEAK